MNATERDADILASQCTGDRLAEAGLSDTRRAVEAEDRRFEVALEFEDREIFHDSFLHFLEAEMVFVENILGVLHVEVVD